jgi:hypothetical protein
MNVPPALVLMAPLALMLSIPFPASAPPTFLVLSVRPPPTSVIRILVKMAPLASMQPIRLLVSAPLDILALSVKPTSMSALPIPVRTAVLVLTV